MECSYCKGSGYEFLPTEEEDKVGVFKCQACDKGQQLSMNDAEDKMADMEINHTLGK